MSTFGRPGVIGGSGGEKIVRETEVAVGHVGAEIESKGRI